MFAANDGRDSPFHKSQGTRTGQPPGQSGDIYYPWCPCCCINLCCSSMPTGHARRPCWPFSSALARPPPPFPHLVHSSSLFHSRFPFPFLFLSFIFAFLLLLFTGPAPYSTASPAAYLEGRRRCLFFVTFLSFYFALFFGTTGSYTITFVDQLQIPTPPSFCTYSIDIPNLAFISAGVKF